MDTNSMIERKAFKYYGYTRTIRSHIMRDTLYSYVPCTTCTLHAYTRDVKGYIWIQKGHKMLYYAEHLVF